MEEALAALLVAVLVFGGYVLGRFIDELRRTVKQTFNIDLDDAVMKAVMAVEELGLAGIVASKADAAYKMVISFMRLRGWKITDDMEKTIRELIISKVAELGYGQLGKKERAHYLSNLENGIGEIKITSG